MLRAEPAVGNLAKHRVKDARCIHFLAAIDNSGYFEGDVTMVKSDSGLDAFEAEVKLAREAGVTVVRSVFTGGRRYEIFKTMEDFRRFTAGAERSLALIEPVLRKHRLKLAIENHKDHT